ncbi:aspartyl/asparaginyl beta-hydroxylase domain-containing protein [Polyangium sp. 6x1]|uniref:aspartyl/asparaginyl beta-hydroxylase domain-containing protein n=1 Tax=Polyangium sp. 6x1 TaxID=3042689 RepID=UPI0024828FFC|nr:aspartyl/asparaginyl beta-hydroxylase domain-containing protein [Polyangium sp. 6x1]MDI1443021.1 aspartyl/asparaginyl beta-hydroxylase domain-containing protein [Polyangium sp. 6x1]
MDDLRQRLGGAGLERVEECLNILVGTPVPPDADPEQEASRLYFPGLRARPWHDTAEFEWVARAEAAYEACRREAEALLDQNVRFSPYEDPDTKELGWRGWDTFPFYVTGKKYPRSCARCPETVRLIDSLPHGTRQGMFSKLNPGAHITPHSGGSNIVLTCHMGLIIPEGCGIRVGSETRAWQEGKCLIFDDSYMHEAWNRGTSVRVVLLWDIWHPELTPIEIQALIHLSNLFKKHRRSLQ